jgi:adenylate cyclase
MKLGLLGGDQRPVDSCVAGYSRLMGADEIGTLQALKAHRKEFVDPTTTAHNM